MLEVTEGGRQGDPSDLVWKEQLSSLSIQSDVRPIGLMTCGAHRDSSNRTAINPRIKAFPVVTPAPIASRAPFWSPVPHFMSNASS